MDQITAERYQGLVKHLKQTLGSEAFLGQHRRSEKDFTRKRCLPFCRVILFLINMVKRALQDELDELFKALQQGKVAERQVTKSAFSQARKKLKHTAFIELNREQVRYCYEHFEPQRWYGFRLLATDGSMSELPHTEAVCQHFGVWHPQSGGVCPKARLSQLFDVLNKVTVDAIIAPKAQGERVLAAQHCQHLSETDLVLLDRGYPAFWLFVGLRQQGAHFCARMSLSEWNVVRHFLASGAQEKIVRLRPSYEAKKMCRALGLSIAPLSLRLLRVELPTGETEVLVTSLLDQVRFPYDVFKELYLKRWPVEVDYNFMKSRLEVENWTGTSVEAVYQDFHATVFTKNLAAILALPAQHLVAQQSQGKKHRYQVNMTNLLSKLKDTVVHLFCDSDILPLLRGLWQQMTKTIEPIRPNRSYPRRKRVKRKRFPSTYKPIR
jgi:Transposase DDE domain